MRRRGMIFSQPPSLIQNYSANYAPQNATGYRFNAHEFESCLCSPIFCQLNHFFVMLIYPHFPVSASNCISHGAAAVYFESKDKYTCPKYANIHTCT